MFTELYGEQPTSLITYPVLLNGGVVNITAERSDTVEVPTVLTGTDKLATFHSWARDLFNPMVQELDWQEIEDAIRRSEASPTEEARADLRAFIRTEAESKLSMEFQRDIPHPSGAAAARETFSGLEDLLRYTHTNGIRASLESPGFDFGNVYGTSTTRSGAMYTLNID